MGTTYWSSLAKRFEDIELENKAGKIDVLAWEQHNKTKENLARFSENLELIKIDEKMFKGFDCNLEKNPNGLALKLAVYNSQLVKTWEDLSWYGPSPCKKQFTMLALTNHGVLYKKIKKDHSLSKELLFTKLRVILTAVDTCLHDNRIFMHDVIGELLEDATSTSYIDARKDIILTMDYVRKIRSFFNIELNGIKTEYKKLWQKSNGKLASDEVDKFIHKMTERLLIVFDEKV